MKPALYSFQTAPWTQLEGHCDTAGLAHKVSWDGSSGWSKKKVGDERRQEEEGLSQEQTRLDSISGNAFRRPRS